MRVAFSGRPRRVRRKRDRGDLAPSVDQIPVPTFSGAVRAVEEGEADACVIPVENSIIGGLRRGGRPCRVPASTDNGEALVPVRHCLLAPKGADAAGIATASITPLPLAQCGRFFEQHPWIKASKSFDTAGAARETL